MAFCVFVLRRPLMVLTRRDWRGGSNLPREGGVVLAVNHVSEVDPLPLAHFVNDHGRIPRFLGKAEVFKVPVVGRILTSAGQIPVYRMSANAAQAFSAAVAAVRRGECLIVYPEGTMTRDPGMWPMTGKSGAARIALTTGCPVIPCAQWGPLEILAPYGRLPRIFPRKLMQIRAGAPVDLSDFEGQELTPELLAVATERVMVAITSLLEEIRGEQAPAVRFNSRSAGMPEYGNPKNPRNRYQPPPAASGDGTPS
jgi:1-acyl-sn-glycerol-3-phosphate acyltransferase